VGDVQALQLNDADGERRPLDSPRYVNRQLSWLDFNSRVLALAEDSSLPLLERVRFTSIFSSNLDEFFQVRVAALKEQLIAGIAAATPDGMAPAETLRAVRKRVLGLIERQSVHFREQLAPQLATHGIRFANLQQLRRRDQAYLDRLFHEQIFPVVTPLAVDPAHPFPYISSLSLNLAVRVREGSRKRARFARIKVPPLLPRFIALPDGETFVPLEQVIAAHLQALFPGMQILSHHTFRVTRDADLDLVDEEAEDLMAAIQTELRRRRTSARVVRLEIDRDMAPEVLQLLMRELEIDGDDVYETPGPLDLAALSALTRLDRPDLKEPVWTPVTPVELSDQPDWNADLFSVLKNRDVLAHHPYESFGTTVEAFIDQASRDPSVLAIKQTLYRTSGPVSAIATALMRAAESGKQAVALVELKARGDEQANITWARALEESGVHVVYGVVGLKTHAKITLLVREEEAGIRRYVHIGTGNYNPETAHLYEDVSLLSADPEIGADVSELFNYLTGYSRQRKYRRLVVAPASLRQTLSRLIRQQAVPGGRIVMKVNNLIDPDVIESLYSASKAGAEIDLIVRSVCGLLPGVAGMSERIRVRSLVGRFLEHSRIMKFGEGPRASYFIGSADLMPRNLDHRVEALVPIRDGGLTARLEEILAANLADDSLAWTMSPDGGWSKVPTTTGFDAQAHFMELALNGALGLAVRAGR
jgi:polyphosphate kinase